MTVVVPDDDDKGDIGLRRKLLDFEAYGEVLIYSTFCGTRMAELRAEAAVRSGKSTIGK